MEAMQNILINIRSVSVLISFSETESMDFEDQPVADATEGPEIPGDIGSLQVPTNHLPCRDISCQLGALSHISNAL